MRAVSKRLTGRKPPGAPSVRNDSERRTGAGGQAVLMKWSGDDWRLCGRVVAKLARSLGRLATRLLVGLLNFSASRLFSPTVHSLSAG